MNDAVEGIQAQATFTHTEIQRKILDEFHFKMQLLYILLNKVIFS